MSRVRVSAAVILGSPFAGRPELTRYNPPGYSWPPLLYQENSEYHIWRRSTKRTRFPIPAQAALLPADKPDGVNRLACIVTVLSIPAGAAPLIKVTPVSLSFTYQAGQTGVPAAQSISIAPASGGTTLAVTIAASGGRWLAVSPPSGRTPLTVRAVVNPTGLPIGSYAGSVAVTAGGEAVNVPVALTIRPPPSTLTAAPSSLTFTWARGEALPDPQSLNCTTSGALLTFTTSVTGVKWLSVTPASGVVFPAFVTSLKIAANPEGLDPGNYKASIGMNAPDAANKTQTVAVALTVQPGKPTVESVWPVSVPAVSDDTTVTITGTNFYPGTVVRVNGVITLRPVVIGSTVMTVVLPAVMLGAPQTLTLSVFNPHPGGGISGAKPFNILATLPRIAAVVDAASFLSRPLAPGQLATVFGSGIGPEELVTFSTPLVGIIYNHLAGVRVLFDGLPAPILYALHNQVGTVVPYGVAGRSDTRVKIDYNGLASEEFTLPLTEHAPGIFTAAGTGSGQAAVFNADSNTGALTLNAESNPAAKGSVIVLYATGEGTTNPPVVDGRISTEPSASRDSSLTVEIGGVEAEVLYAGAAPGLVAGVMQINIKIPATLTVSRTAPVILKIGSAASQPGATIAVK